jgi:hypothetical protein
LGSILLSHCPVKPGAPAPPDRPVALEDMTMTVLVTAFALALISTASMAAESSCTAQATEKKIYGAAKTSFMTKCEREMKASCGQSGLREEAAWRC